MRRNNANSSKSNDIIRTEIKNVDLNLGGLRKGDLILLGSGTKVDKSALALNIVNNLAMREACPCLYISTKTPKMILEKKLCRIGGDKTFETLFNIDGRLNQLFYFIDSYSDFTSIDSLFDVIRKYTNVFGAQFVVIDYLQPLIKNCSKKPEQHLANLKQLATELNIAILSLFNFEKSTDGKIQKSEAFNEHYCFIEKSDTLMILSRNGFDDISEGNIPHYEKLTILENQHSTASRVKVS